jgi:eukaryotic-like serine/threonine-protein kinase
MLTAAEQPRLQRFDVVRTLGAGGMGVVYEAFDRERQVRVALKTMKSLSADLRLRFKNEFRALQGIHHPNLVTLGELFEEEGQLYFTMELVRGMPFIQYVRPGVPGGLMLGSQAKTLISMRDSATLTATLADRPRSRQPTREPAPLPGASAEPRGVFDEPRLRNALAQLASGLHALHLAGCIHRDIKPSNVLVTPQGRVVILDFGLVMEADRAEERQVVGTAHYMAPEQAAGAAVGPAADWYALGVMLYQALTGRRPFDGLSEAVMRLKQQRDPPAPGTVASGLPGDLEELCMRLLQRNPAARLQGQEVLRLLGAAADHELSSLLSSRHGFVGRELELRQLTRAFEHTRNGQLVQVLVEGESGMGKSILVRHFLDSIAHEALIFSGRCYERDSVPYKAVDEIIAALGHYLRELPPELAETLLPPGADLLAQVFPELELGVAPDAEREAMDPIMLRNAVFSTLRELFRRLAEHTPLVLAIDDLQWTDADSMALLAEVMRQPEAPRLLLVATLRTATETSALRVSEELLAPVASARRILLHGLPVEEAQALVGTLLEGVALPRGVDVAAIISEARGHPLFIDALVRHRLVQGEQSAEGVRLDEALWYRVQRLEQNERRVVELVAVAGRPVPLGVAAQTLAHELDEVLRSTVRLQAERLVRVTTAGSQQFVEPFHDRVRETVTSRLEPAARRTWHGRLALALELSGRAELETLALHWAEAGEHERAAGYAARAGEQAAAALAFDHAARLFRRALELGQGDDEQALRLKLAEALYNAGRGSEAAEAYLRAASKASSQQALELGQHAAQCYLYAGYIDEGLTHFRPVLAAARLEPPRSTPGLLAALVGWQLRLRLRGFAFRERQEQEIEPAVLQRVDTSWAMSRSLAVIDAFRGAYFHTRNLLLALEAGEPGRIARALGVEATFAALGGTSSRARAEAVLARAEAAAERSGQPYALGFTLGARGFVSFFLGRFREALPALERSVSIFREQCVGAWLEHGTTMVLLLWSLWMGGSLRELSRRATLYLREADEHSDRLLATCLGSGYINSRWLVEDRPEEALREARQAIESWERYNRSHASFQQQHFYDMAAVGQQGLYTGDYAGAHHYLRERWPAFRRSLASRLQMNRIVICQLRARTALACASVSRDARERRALLALVVRSAHALERERAEWATPQADLLLAGVAMLENRPEAALALLRRAAHALNQVSLLLPAAAAARRWGLLLGGEQGRKHVEEGERWMRAQGVVNPERMTAMLVPGFPD